jgi:shikimate 5-dehydrogenase
MLVAQAVGQFEWWFGVRPSAELFRTAAVAALADQPAIFEHRDA